jgi:hypothetical protein
MTAARPKLGLADCVAIAVAAVSAGALLLEMTWPHRLEGPPPAGEASTELAQAALEVVPVGPVLDYLSVSERPLFRFDRRPFAFVAEAAPVVAAGPRAEFELTAVIITHETQIALLRSNVTPTVQRLTLHQIIDGWTLAEVTPESVILRQGTEAVTVPLRPDLGAASAGHAARVQPGDIEDGSITESPN